MNDAVVFGVPAALLATVLYGLAPLVQARVVRTAPEGGGLGLGLVLSMLRQPVWLLGVGCGVGAFVLEATAYSEAPVALVSPILSCDMVVLALLARFTVGERIGRRGGAGIAVMATGVLLLALSFGDDSELGRSASALDVLLFAAVGLVVVGACVLGAGRSGRWATVPWFGIGAGACYAIATLCTRQIGLALHDSDLLGLFWTPTPYVLGLSSLLALSLQQRGLQSAAAVVTYPVMSTVSSFIPVGVALTLLDEPAPTGLAAVGFGVALVVMVTGVALLGTDRVTQQPLAAPEPAPGPDDPAAGPPLQAQLT